MKTHYPYTIEKDADGFLFVQFLDLEEAFTQGETLEEATFNAQEVLSAMLAYRLEHNQDIPDPSPCFDHAYTVTPRPEVQAALLVKNARGDRLLSELATAMEHLLAGSEKTGKPPLLA